jgi:hypothetical protein
MNKKLIIQFFHYLWIVMAVAFVFFVLSQAFYTKRSLEYHLNFAEPISKDSRVWYPEQRIKSDSSADIFEILAEPLYMKIYSPIDFKQMSVKGTIHFQGIDNINLGLKQLDGSWDYKKITSQDFFMNFDLSTAQTENNQLEMILSIPDIASSTELSLINNWQVILTR